MAGMKDVVEKSREGGTIDIADLEARTTEHADALAATLVTYPSTHGVFEEELRVLCRLVHEHGVLVYLDGAYSKVPLGVGSSGGHAAEVW